MRLIDADALKKDLSENYVFYGFRQLLNDFYQALDSAPSIDIVFCKECKHRPVKEDANGEDYGFNLIEPTEDDDRCPCLVDDGWYSWMPKDDFYCGYGEREGE